MSIFTRSVSSEAHNRRLRTALPAVETLEGRLVLNGARTMMAFRFGYPDSARAVVLQRSAVGSEAVGSTISGRVLNAATNKGVARVKVELIDSDGLVLKTTRINARGTYSLKVAIPGAYVVHEVVPKKFRQVAPSFVNEEPTGTLSAGFGGTSWNYATGNSDPANGPVGPPFWNTIGSRTDDAFESPIDLTGPTVDLSSLLAIHYADAIPSKIINNGHQIQVQFPAGTTADTINLTGTSYSLSQFHYHDQSENTVNGKSYSMEAHFVNVSAAGGETVVSVFLQLGAHNNALDPILNAASAALTAPNSSFTPTTPVDFAGLLPPSKQGWFFEGSLTTPPLSGPINWLVFSKPITLDFAQLKQYEDVAAGAGFWPNNRPLQPLDGRQLNEFNQEVVFTGQSLTGVNFTIAKVAAVASRGKAKKPAVA